METLRSNKALSTALAAVTTAVVGVILNLAAWFAMHILFGEVTILNVLGLNLDVPVLASIRPASLLLTLAAIIAVFRFHLGVLTVLAGCSVLGLVDGLLGGMG